MTLKSKNMKKTLTLLIMPMLILVSNLTAQNNSHIVKELEQYALQVQSKWKIPGMAVSIVKDGEVIYSQGFGVKELGTDQEVTPKTVFQIGSVSKSFTAAVMASLVDEGKVKWEDSVKNILPDFKMFDKWVESNLQVKDIMTHRTGLEGQLGTYIPNMGYEREDIYKMLPLLKPKYSMRGSYEYNNITFIIASKIIEKLTGKSWEENVRERIFIPLGMESSYVTGKEFVSAPDVSTPHEFTYIDSVVVKPLYGEEQALHWLSVIGPAGSISSNVEDMSKYLLFQLNKGLVGDKQVLSVEQMNYLRRGQTITSQDSARITLYGHCWFVEQNSRYRVIFHTGTTWGFTALCAFIPEQNLGIVILVNSEAPAFPRYAIMRRLIDLYKGFPNKDYNSLFYQEWLTSARKGREESLKKESERVAVKAPQSNVITGRYKKDDLFGTAVVTEEGGKLFITIGPKGWKSVLTHKNGNEYSFRMGGNEFKTTFSVDEKSGVCGGMDVSFGYSENFGLWTKLK